MSLRFAIGVAFSLLHVLPASALTVADCELWMTQLGDETATLPIGGTDREFLLRRLDEVSRKDRGPTLKESLENVTKFQERAAALAKDGKVSRTEGQRLETLSETVRRCLERVGGGTR